METFAGARDENVGMVFLIKTTKCPTLYKGDNLT